MKTLLILLLAGPAFAAASAPKKLPVIEMPVAPAAPAAFVTGLDKARETAAQKLVAAKMPEALAARGWEVWQILHYQRRTSGETMNLTLDAFGAAEGETDEALRARLEAEAPELAAMLAGALELEAERIILRFRRAKSCCGVGCQNCLKGARPGA